VPLPKSAPGELPEGWKWTTTEDLAKNSKAGPFGSSLKKEYYVSNGYKIYGQEQVIRGDPYYGDYYIDEERYKQLKSNAVEPGDILISLVGTIGKVLILPENIQPGIINPRLVKLSLRNDLIDSKYFKYYMETKSARHYFSAVSHGETMKILNLGILRKLPIPLPPLAEQRRIVAEVERRLSVAKEVESAVNVALARAVRLRQAVLKAAFEGRL
jgi:type I restriction enzyme S subunit